MKIIQFPGTNGKEQIKLTKDEYNRFIELQKLLTASINPNEASYYKKQIDVLITLGRSRKI